MGRDVWQGFFWFMLFVVFPDKPLEHTFITGRYFGITALVEEKEVLVDRIACCKCKKAVLLLLGQCDLRFRVILQNGIQGKVERVLADTVILDCRVEGSF